MEQTQSLDIYKVYDAYVEAMLWSECDEAGNPLDDNYTKDSLTDESRKRAMKDVISFIVLLKHERIPWRDYGEEKDLGHDFWLTRQGHGAGFWDGDWNDIGDRLTELCKPYGELYPWINDDGMIDIL